MEDNSISLLQMDDPEAESNFVKKKKKKKMQNHSCVEASIASEDGHSLVSLTIQLTDTP